MTEEEIEFRILKGKPFSEYKKYLEKPNLEE